jgi:hypothetical protein
MSDPQKLIRALDQLAEVLADARQGAVVTRVMASRYLGSLDDASAVVGYLEAAVNALGRVKVQTWGAMAEMATDNE